MEMPDFVFALGERFPMRWGNHGDVVFAVIDRMHTDRGNMYWVQTRDHPKFTKLFLEAYLEKERSFKARNAAAAKVERGYPGGARQKRTAPFSTCTTPR